MEKDSDLLLEQLRSGNKRYTVIALGVIVFNSLLYPWLVHTYPTFSETLKVAMQLNFIYLSLIGFVIGSLIALFPYKKLSYRNKYLRASLLFILVIQGLEMLGLLLIALMKWGLHYPI